METRRKVKTKQDEKRKLVSVLDYDRNVIAADLKNQLLYTYLAERKT
jgi:hypothetical protein